MSTLATVAGVWLVVAFPTACVVGRALRRAADAYPHPADTREGGDR